MFFSVYDFLKMPQMAQLCCFIIKLICQCVSPTLDEIMLQALTVGSPLLQKNKEEELTVVE